MSDSREFPDVESICSGKLSCVPSQLANVPSLCGMLSLDQICDVIHGICSVHRETFLTVHVQLSIRHRHLIKEFFTLGINVPQAKNPVRESTGNLSLEVKKEIESQHRDL